MKTKIKALPQNGKALCSDRYTYLNLRKKKFITDHEMMEDISFHDTKLQKQKQMEKCK